MTTYQRIVLASRPKAEVQPDNFRLETVEIPAIKDGELLVRNHYLSLDPYMRGRMSESKSYAASQALDETMIGGTVGEVIESKHPKFAAGDTVVGTLGWSEVAVSDGTMLRKVDTTHVSESAYLGSVGMPGMTAWYGLNHIMAPKAGETVVVSAASGAVGSVVGQLAKLKGCRVVGIAGGKEKCNLLIEELGFDGVIDYKNEDVIAGLKRECPKGVDVYFDNVGGDILDAVLSQLNFKARVIICGAISQYNNKEAVKGPANYLSLLVNRARMEGFIVMDYADRYVAAGQEMAGWLAKGQLKSREDIVEGLETFPETLMKLFSGENNGKLILKV